MVASLSSLAAFISWLITSSLAWKMDFADEECTEFEEQIKLDDSLLAFRKLSAKSKKDNLLSIMAYI